MRVPPYAVGPDAMPAARDASIAARTPQPEAQRPPLVALATAALLDVARRSGLSGPEVAAVAEREPALAGEWWRSFDVAAPVPEEDLGVAALTAMLGLGRVEQLTVALLAAMEEDQLLIRLITALQAPVTGSRLLVGLAAAAFAAVATTPDDAYAELLDGPASRAGVFALRGDDQMQCERRLALPPPVLAALRGRDTPVAGVTVGARPAVALPASTLAEAARHAAAFTADEPALVVRTPSVAEGRAACAAVAAALGYDAAFIEGEPPAGLGVALSLRGLVPVFARDSGPSERHRLPALPGYFGPLLVLAGLEGSFDRDSVAIPSWRLTVPSADERAALWRAALDDAALADALGAEHRHGAGRIAQLGRAARRAARLEGARAVERRHVRAAAWTSEGPGLRGLAEPIADDVPDQALVTSAPLRRDLELLLLRCRSRDGLVDGLGAAMRARHRPGVRALFVGPSGTGKTFAASWLASRLAAPLYRVDLAAVTSKYIGETEKNLAALLGQAEHEEVVLLFDEADSMFGKRTDVKDANDRFANSQTNFLLQRIESFDGIVLLTSNSRTRIDAAFTRRLDAVIDFPPPGPEERRALWRAHLGEHHELEPATFNRLAATCDLAGGHVRNAVLCASLLARRAGRRVRLPDLVTGLAVEYRKLGRTLPGELGEATPIVNEEAP
ncbi:ATP-binding protein [Sorangium sp. So ce385]|uniref:ATP-binding protein n=1 Tax=Sorangium sp. So ce385 TaxID=3133308 RepID=UPI003F5C6500